MSLNWNWNEKVGYAIVESQGKTFELSLYKGNAYLIFIDEYEENGDKYYSLYSFFADKQHALNCLGLAKGYENIFIHDGKSDIKEIALSPKYPYLSQLLGMLLKAFRTTGIKFTLIPEEG